MLGARGKVGEEGEWGDAYAWKTAATAAALTLFKLAAVGIFLKEAQSHPAGYSAFDRELLACTAGIRHFRHMLDGREFSILTDHKPITFALARATDAWTPRQGRHLSYIAEYTSDIWHIPGKENVVADTMSRPPAAPHTAGPVGAHTTGPDSCLTAGPACAHNAGPDSCLTAGPASTHTAGPDSSAWLEDTLAGLNSLTAEVPPACAAEINFSAMAARRSSRAAATHRPPSGPPPSR